MVRSLVLVIVAVGFAAACGQPGEQRSAALTPEATAGSATAPAATSAPVPTATPPIGAWTGIAELDEIIRLELAGDGKALADRLQMKRVACTLHPEPLGYPPLCAPGETEGQIVEAFPEGNCEGFLQRPDKAREEIARALPKTEFYAALAPAAPQEGTETGYWLVFSSAPPASPGGIVYVVRGDRIVSWFGACNGAGAIESGRARLLPLTNTGIAPDRSTRIAPLDGIIAAVEGDRVDQLTTRLVYRDSHCAERYSPGDGLYCLQGEADGSKTHLFSADGCVSTLLRGSEAEALLTAALEDAPPKLYAIGLPTLAEAQAFNYRVFFAWGDGADARGFALDILDGRIVRFDSGCGPVARRAATVTTFVVPPAVPPSPADPDAVTATGLADVDEIAQLVTSGDMAAIVTRTKTTAVPCGRPGDAFGRVDCGSEAPGTPIESVATGYRLYERVADAVRFHLAAQGLSLYSVSRISPVGRGECGTVFAPAYTLTFSWVSSPPFAGVGLVSIYVGGGQIVGIGGGCDIGWPPDVAAGYILRPPDQR